MLRFFALVLILIGTVDGFKYGCFHSCRLTGKQRGISARMPLKLQDTETYNFESNVSRVMDIIINSLYSNKDVFLRELISNAADACDKKRFLALTESGEGAVENDDLGIKVFPNRKDFTLTIEDSGIGMSKEDIMQNLGRIAESGTKRFMENMDSKDADAVSLIGQFGVGFYSGFLVANKMTVVTKKAGGEQLRWEANVDALDSYTIASDDGPEIEGSGTRITLHLKDEADQYVDDIALRALIEKYSEFIAFPISLQREVTKPEEVPDTDKGPDSDGTIPMKTVMTKSQEWDVVNTKKPLWLRSPRQCEQEEYTEFYKQSFGAWDEPAAQTHFSVEGNVDFKALLYLPSEVPYELTRDMFAASARSLRLYVKRVFINDKFEDLIPRWLLFIRGVVDSNDLPLNVGREILQQSRALRIIRTRLVKKSIDMITDLSNNNATAYGDFWKNFGKYIKVGIIEDEKSRDDLTPLVRFFSSKSDDKLTSLPEYVERMPEDQKYIYYAVGETRAQAAASPALEKLKKQGYEVLYVSEPIDEMTLQNIDKFNEKQITDVGKELNDLTEDEKKEKDEANEAYEGMRLWMKNVLGDRITKVEVSTRLVDSPATLVQSEYGVSPNMQKYLRAQAVVESDDKGEFANIFNQAVLEINPTHPIIQDLKAQQEADQESQDAKQMAELVFNTAALAAGYALENAADYAKLVTSMMTRLADK